MLCVFCSFVQGGMILFSETFDFTSPLRSIQSLLGFAAGFYTSTDLLEQHSFRGGWFLVSHKIIFDLFLMTVTMVILENSFRENKILFAANEEASQSRLNSEVRQRKRFRAAFATRRAKGFLTYQM